MLQKIIARFFPRSLKLAYQQWQQAEAQRDENKQRLSRQLTEARLAAQAAGVDTPQNVGLIRQGEQLHASPPSHKLVAVHIHVNNIFRVHGTSRWRSAPPGLWKHLEDYEALLTEERRQWEEIIDKLQLIVACLKERAEHPEYAFSVSPAYIFRISGICRSPAAVSQSTMGRPSGVAGQAAPEFYAPP